MKFTRPSRVFAALLALVGVLFMQLALAVYVCPAVVESPAPMAQMASCDDPAMDPVQPTLCAGQDYARGNSLDKPATPVVTPFIAASFVGTVMPVPPLAMGASAATRLPSPPPAPPASLRHCCLRL